MSSGPILIRCRSCKTVNRVPSDRLGSHPICGQCKTALDYPHEPIHVTEASFDAQVREWPEFLLAEFWAKWCGYCRKIEPYINGLAARHSGRLKIIRIDVDAEQRLAGRFTIKATPTFLLFRNGRQLARFDGAPVRDEDMEHWLETAMKNAP